MVMQERQIPVESAMPEQESPFEEGKKPARSQEVSEADTVEVTQAEPISRTPEDVISPVAVVAGETRSEPQPVYDVTEGPMESKTTTEESEQQADNGMTIKRKVTTTKHYTPLITITTVGGRVVDSVVTGEQLVGTTVEEEILILPQDVTEPYPEDANREVSVQEFEEVVSDGTWLKTNVTETVLSLKVPEVTEGEVQTRTDVKEHEETLDDGTTVKTTTTVTEHYKTITEGTNSSEVIVGQQIDEVVYELAPGVNAVDQEGTETETSEQEYKDTLPDGAWQERKVTKTTVKLPAVIESEVQQRTDVQEHHKTLDDGTTVKVTTTTVEHYKTVTVGRDTTEVPVGTEINEVVLEIAPGVTHVDGENTTTHTSEDESEATADDGTWVKRKTTTTTVTLVQREIVESEVQTKEDVQQHDEVLDDGTTVRTTTKTTVFYKTRSDGIETTEVPVGIEIDKTIVQVAPGASAVDAEGVTSKTTDQETEDTLPDGTWLRQKTTTTVISLAIVESEVQTRVDIQDHDEVLDDGTTVKITTTTTEHYKTVTEGTTTSEVIVGRDVYEDITELAPGVNDVDQANTTRKTDEQESEDMMPDGSWLKQKTVTTTVTLVEESIAPEEVPMAAAAAPEEPEAVESEVQQRKDVKEHHKVMDDGTDVTIRTTTTEHFKTVTIGDDVTEVPVGKDIDEVVIEMAPGVTHVEEGYTTSHTSEDESEETADDGTWVKRKTTTTTVTLVQREVVESEVQTKEDVQQHDEVLDDGTTVRTTTKTTVFYKTRSDGVETTEVPVGTEIDRTIVQVAPGASAVGDEGVTSKTTDQETEDTLPDGTWLRQKTTTTVISLAIVESEVQTRVDIQDHDEVLDDGTTVKITTTTTEHYKTVTEGTTTSEVIVGRDVFEDITELAPGVNDVDQANTTRKTDEQESEDMMPDGSWLKQKTVTTTVTLVEESIAPEEVPMAAAAAPEEPEAVESEVQQRKDVKEHHKVMDDGTDVTIRTTTTEHFKTVTIGDDVTEVPVGKDIDEVVIEMAPGVTHVEEGYTTSHTSEDESEETADDGTWVKRKTTTTTVTLVQREVVESEVQTKEDVQQHDEVLDDGTTVRTTTKTTVFYKTRSDGVETTEVPVGTEIDRTIVQVAPGASVVGDEGVTSKTTDQETEDTLPDGTWLRQKTTTTVISLAIVESEVQTRVDIQDHDEVLDDGTTVKITTTTTEHYKTVTEGTTTSEVIVGRDVFEDITELAPGVNDVDQANTTRKTDEQESEDMMPDGSWLKQKTVTTTVTLVEESIAPEEVPMAAAAAPEEPEAVESEVQQRKDVKEHHKVMDDGTDVTIRTTTTEHFKTVAVGDDVTEIPVGTEIDEVVIEMAPGVTHVEEGYTKSHTSEDESEETADDGTWVKRKTTTTTVTLVQREVVESEVQTKEDVQQHDEVLDDGTTVRTTTKTTVFYKTRSDGVETTEVPVGTEIDRTIVQVAPGASVVGDEGVTSKTTDQETEDTLPDGTWLRQKTTTTVISLAIVESEVQTRVDIQDHDEVLDDGTTVKITTTTTEHYKTVTEGTTTSEVIVGRDVFEDITELAPGVNDVDQANTTRKTDEQESEDMMPDGSWLKQKTVTTTVTLVEESIAPEEVPMAAAAAPEEPEAVESEVQQRKDVKEHHKVMDDGTDVTIRTTTTEHFKTVAVGDDVTEIPVGTEIDEVVIEMAPGVTHVEEGYTKSHTSEDESEETADDGTWVKRKTTTTTVTLVQREVVESEVQTKEDVQKHDEVLDDGTTVRITTKTTVFYKTRSDGIETTEVPVGTEIDKTIVQVAPGASTVDAVGVTSKTTDQETEDTLPDGTWLRQKTTTTVISLAIVESEVQTRVDIQDHDEVLDDGTTVKITTTTTEHYKTVTEGTTTSEVIVGRDVYEDITELAPGVNYVEQANTTRKTDEQESEDMMPDGSWLKQKTVTTTVTLVEESIAPEEVPMAAAAAPEEPEAVESEVQQRKDVKEHHKVMDDGTDVTIRTTTTEHFKTVTIGDDVTEVPVGKDIDEVVIEMAPGVTHVEEGYTTSHTSEDESEETADDGTWVKRKTTTTTVTLVQREVVESEVQTKEDVQQHDEVLDDGTTVRTTTKTTVFYKTRSDGVETTEVPVGTEIDKTIVQVAPGASDDQEDVTSKTTDKETEDTLPDGTWLRQKTTTTVISLVEVELEPEVVESEVQQRTDVKEHHKVLDDGTNVKITTTTVEHYKTITAGDDTVEVPVGKEIVEVILEMAPGITHIDEDSTTSRTSEDEADETAEDGTWVKRKTQTTVVSLVDRQDAHVMPVESPVSEEAPADRFVEEEQAPVEELAPTESPVSEKPEEREEVMPVESPVSEEAPAERFVEEEQSPVEELLPIPEGEIQTRTDVQEHEEVLDDGTNVKTVTTTTEHYVVTGDEYETKEIHVGKDIQEEIIELSPGVTDIHQENTRTKTSVQESQKGLPGGRWEKRKVTRITVTAVHPDELMESIAADVASPDVQSRTNVQEHDEVLDDGTKVKTIITTIEYSRINSDGDEVLIGKDISEDVVELGTGITDVEQENTRTKTSVQDSLQMSQDTWVKRKVTRIVVTWIEGGVQYEQVDGAESVVDAVPVPTEELIPAESPVSEKPAEKEEVMPVESPVSEEAPADRFVEEQQAPVEELVTAESPISDKPEEKEEIVPVESIVSEEAPADRFVEEEQAPAEELLPIPEGEIQTRTDVQEHEEVLDDGTNVNTVTTTIVHFVVTVHGNITKEIHVGKDIQEEIVELSPGVTDIHQENTRTKTSVQESQKGLPGGRWEKRKVTRITVTAVHPDELMESIAADVGSPDVQSRTDVQEHDEALDDGTKVKTTITTIDYTRINPDGSVVLIGKDISEDIVELGPGITDVEQQNTRTKTSVQDSLQMSQDTWVKRKVTRIVVTWIEGGVQYEQVDAAESVVDAVPVPTEELIPAESPVSEKPEEKEAVMPVESPVSEEAPADRFVEEEQAPVDELVPAESPVSEKPQEKEEVIPVESPVSEEAPADRFVEEEQAPVDELVPAESPVSEKPEEKEEVMPVDSPVSEEAPADRFVEEEQAPVDELVPAESPVSEKPQEKEEVIPVESPVSEEAPADRFVEEEQAPVEELVPAESPLSEKPEEKEEIMLAESPVSEEVPVDRLVEEEPAPIEELVPAGIPEGKIDIRTDVQEHEEVLDNGTTVKTVTTTNGHYIMYVEEDTPKEVLIGQEIHEEITELGPGVTGVQQEGTRIKTSVQDSQKVEPNGYWQKRRVTHVTVTVVRREELLEVIAADVNSPDVQSRTDIQKHSEILDDETNVSTVTTVVEYYKISPEGDEMPVGKDVKEDIVELGPGVKHEEQENTKTKIAVQESHQMVPEGTWVQRKITRKTVTSIQLEEGITALPSQIPEGDIQTRTDVQEHEEVLDDGTNVKTVTTTTDHYIVTENEEISVGKDIHEEITELCPGVTDVHQENTKTKTSVQESQKGLPGGRWEKRKVTRVTVTSVQPGELLEVITADISNPDVHSRPDIQEHEEVLDDGTVVRTTTTIVAYCRITHEGEEVPVGKDVKEDIVELAPGITHMEQENTRTKKYVQESHQMTSEGTWVRRVVTRMIVSTIQREDGLAAVPAPIPEGEIQTRTDVQEHEEVLDDGTKVKTVTTTTEHYIVAENAEEISVGKDIHEEIVELSPGVTDIHQENTRTKTSVQESQKGLPGGRWEKRKVTRITVTAVHPDELMESIAADVASPDVQSRTDVQEHDEVLDNGTKVKTTVTTIEYFRVTVEGNETLVGRDVAEDILELGPGVTHVEQENSKTRKSVQDSLQMSQGTWLKRKVTTTTVSAIERSEALTAIPTQPGGDLERSTDVQEKEEVLDDGTRVKTTTTTTLFYRWVDGDAAPVGTEINEEIVRMAPGVTDMHQNNTRTQTSVQESQQVTGDQTWVKRKVTTIIVTLVQPGDDVASMSPAEEIIPAEPAFETSSAPKQDDDDLQLEDGERVEEYREVLPDGTVVVKRRVVRSTVTKRIRRVGPDGEVIEEFVTDSEILSEASSLSDIRDGPPSDADSPVESDDEGKSAEGMRVFMDTKEGEPVTETDVQEFEETLPDGSIVKRKVVKTTQKQTIVKRVIMDSPEGEMPAMTDEEGQWVAMAEPEMVQYGDKIFGEPETTSDVQEYDETLPDGTVVKRRVVTKRTQQMVTERTIVEGAGDMLESMNGMAIPAPVEESALQAEGIAF